MEPHEPRWRTLDEQVVLPGRFLVVRRRVELPDGTLTDYDVDVSAPFAVAVLLVLGGEVVVTRQYRYPVDRWILDLPAGGGHPGETPREAARREVEEETGLVPTDLEPLHVFFQNPGRSAWPVHLFHATAASRGTPATDDAAEQVGTLRMPLTELDRHVREDEVVDPALLIARLMAGARGLLPPLGPPDPAPASAG